MRLQRRRTPPDPVDAAEPRLALEIADRLPQPNASSMLLRMRRMIA
jgi:hypothetical protein